MFRRCRMLSLLCVAFLVLAGCRDSRLLLVTTATSLGLIEASPQPPVVLALVVDASAGSVSREHALALGGAAVRFVASHSPGSEVRIYVLGDDLAHSASPALILIVPKPAMSGERSRRAMESRFLAEATPRGQAVIERAFASPPRHSPIAGTIVAAAIASRPRNAQLIIALATDAREESVAHLECSVPSERSWLASLRRNGLFLPKQLESATVIFTYFAPTPVESNRCPVTMDHHLAIRHLWESVIRRAGGEVRFETNGLPEELP